MTDIASSERPRNGWPFTALADGISRIGYRLTGFSVRTKMLGIVVGLTVLLGLGVTWQVRSVVGAVLIAELDNRGASVASDIAARSAEPLLLNDTFGVFEVLDDAVTNHPDVEYAFVLSRSNEVLAHTFGEAGFPVGLLEHEAGTTDPGERHTHFESSTAVYHEFAASIATDGVAEARVGLSESRLIGIVNGITTQLLITTGLVAIVGVAAASLLTWLLTRPVLSLVETTREVRDGNLAIRSAYRGADEIGALSLAFNQMVDELQTNREIIHRTEAARSRLLEKLISAQEEERKRLARELHDSVGQSLISLMVGMPMLTELESDEAQAMNQGLQRLAQETLQHVREMSRELRPSVLDDLGLEAALERYVVDFSLRYPEIEVDVQGEFPDRLDPAIETAVYRIVQEAMTNSARHGLPSHIGVVLAHREGTVRVVVEDDGRGFDTGAKAIEHTSMGLHAMKERAELLGGAFAVESDAGGTGVFVELPV